MRVKGRARKLGECEGEGPAGEVAGCSPQVCSVASVPCSSPLRVATWLDLGLRVGVGVKVRVRVRVTVG